MTHNKKHRIVIYSLTLLILAFNLSSHSHGYWPGDTWLLRTLYWLARFSMELMLFYGTWQLIKHYLPEKQFYIQLPAAIVISSIPFTLALAMLDIATGRPDTYSMMVELQNTGAIGGALWLEWLETLARHIAFCCLISVIDYYTRPAVPVNNEATDTPPSQNPAFLKKLSPKNHGEPLRIQAQEHYISITTPKATELIQYRFGLAVNEVEAIAGRQVHRSFWVADSNVKGWQQMEQGIRLHLHHGDPVPVSRRFEHSVKTHYMEIDPV